MKSSGERNDTLKPLGNRSIAVSAALAGLLGGTVARLDAAPFQNKTQNNAKATMTPVAEKHSCAGKNSCKGKGGCATDGSRANKSLITGLTDVTSDKHSCSGKNSCKGKGGCATDGRKM